MIFFSLVTQANLVQLIKFVSEQNPLNSVQAELQWVETNQSNFRIYPMDIC